MFKIKATVAKGRSVFNFTCQFFLVQSSMVNFLIQMSPGPKDLAAKESWL